MCPLKMKKNVPIFLLGDASFFSLKYSLVILIIKNLLLFLMYLCGTLWFHVLLFFPTYQRLEILLKSNLLRGFDPKFLSNSTHTLHKLPQTSLL